MLLKGRFLVSIVTGASLLFLDFGINALFLLEVHNIDLANPQDVSLPIVGLIIHAIFFAFCMWKAGAAIQDARLKRTPAVIISGIVYSTITIIFAYPLYVGIFLLTGSLFFSPDYLWLWNSAFAISLAACLLACIFIYKEWRVRFWNWDK